MRFMYDDTVLEPRPWTAAQADWGSEVAHDLAPGPLLELCCGVGHIGLLAASSSARDAVLVDASPAACAFADGNADQLRPGVDVQIRCADLEDALRPDETFPLVLADPPYIPHDQTGAFPQDPLDAIDGGPDGLELARICLSVAAAHLVTGGVLILQLRDDTQVETLVAEDRHGAGLTLREVRETPRGGALALFLKH